MKTRILNMERVGGVVLIAAMVVMLVGAAVANFTLARNHTGFGGAPEEILAAVAANPSAWRFADILILVAIILTALGFVPITLGFGKPGCAWAWAALLTYSISAVFGATRRIISIYLETWVAVEGIELNDSTVEAFSRFGKGLGEWFTILAFTTIALYGIALLHRLGTGSLGWLFIGGGAIGVLVHLIGAGIPAFIFFETGALGLAIFMHERPSASSEA